MAAKKIQVTALDVRTWAVQNGHNVSPAAGRLPFAVVEAFHAANKDKKYAGPVPKVTVVKGIRVNASGRKTPVTKGLTVQDVRAAAAEAGITLNTGRGRLPKAAYAAAAGVGTWDALTA